MFKLEFGLLFKDNFYDMVIEIWQKETRINSFGNMSK
jgi:hypothetical protein